MRTLLCLICFAVLSSSAFANDQIKTIESKYSVKETLDRLSAILTKKGIKIMARVDHAAGAKAAGLELPPTELLIFGNPKLGTPLMQSQRLIGLDLPMKALAWQNSDGKTQLSYTTPAALKSRHGINDRDKIFGVMTKALAGLTGNAAK